jgi:hypothetical protein
MFLNLPGILIMLSYVEKTHVGGRMQKNINNLTKLTATSRIIFIEKRFAKQLQLVS